MAKYRKKPVVIEAWRWLPNRDARLDTYPPWAIGRLMPDVNCLYVETLEGRMRCDVGDWIIHGVEGEIYPCKDSVFQMSYEPVED